MTDIQGITIQSAEEKFAPPEQPVLNLSVHSELLFIDIGKYEETNKEMKFTTTERITVNVKDFSMAFNTLVQAEATAMVAKAIGNGSIDDNLDLQERIQDVTGLAVPRSSS